MRLVFFGTSDFGIPALDALKKSSHALLSVVTAPDKPAGRRLKLEPSPVKAWAVENNVPCLEFRKENLSKFIGMLRSLEADGFIVISFGVILSKEILAIPRLWALNVHASLLPSYRGPSPIQTALLNGNSETGVSVMRMVEKLDAGDVLLQKKTGILPEEDAGTLGKKLSVLSAGALLEALDLLGSGRARFIPQEEKKVSWTKKIKKEDGRIDWNLPALSIENKIRAMAGWPGSFSFHEGKRILVIKAHAKKKERSAAPPGTLLKASAEEGVWVATRDFPLDVEELQMEGRKAMKAKDFLKGFSLKAGSVLE